MEVIKLKEEHLEEAAELFAAGYRREREQVPCLPQRHEGKNGVLPMLAGFLKEVPGAAVVDQGRLVGYLMGMALPEFKGVQRGAYSPDWAHGAAEENRGRVYRHLYEYISREWVKNGCFTHAITLFAHDPEALDAWFWNGFGMQVVDAVRTLDSVEGPVNPEVTIRRAGPRDMDSILALVGEHQRYMAQPPLFMPLFEMDDREYFEEWMQEAHHVLWLASWQGEDVGYIKCNPPKYDNAYSITDPKTINVSGLFTRKDMRRTGIGTALLNELLTWARSEGFERCAVDFEAFNIYGSRFWMRHFQPVCYSVIRKLDERIAWAHGDRKEDGIW